MASTDDFNEARRIVVELHEKSDSVILEKKSIQLELSNIRSKIRRAGRMPPEIYKQMSLRQQYLQRRMFEVEVEISEIKAEIRRWADLEHEEYQKAFGHREAKGEQSTPGFRAGVVEMRDRYLRFSEDHTRVNSMRLMAAGFATELTELLRNEG